MNFKKILIMVYIIACAVISVSAQEDVSTKETGIYQRKSIAFLNTTINKSNRNLPEEWAKAIDSVLQDSLRLVRFDFNNIPKSITDKFKKMPDSMSVEKRMDSTVVPAILAAVDAEKESRALALLSDQQRNSFITDKAKELGITEDELNTIMNSAYIFAPVFLGYRDTTSQRQVTRVDKNGNSYTTTITIYHITPTISGYWWKIDNTGEKPSVKLIAHIERRDLGTQSMEESDYRYKALVDAIPGIAKKITIATKNIPDFQLTAQVLDKTPRNTVISVADVEGVRTDDKFRAYKSIEDADGNIKEKRNGWVMIKKVGERAEGLDSTQSKAQIISGRPYIGSTVREIPHHPIDIAVTFGQTPISVSTKGQDGYNAAWEIEKAKIKELYSEDDYEYDGDFPKGYSDNEWTKYDSLRRMQDSLKNEYMGDVRFLKLSDMYGPRITVRANILRNAGLSQWWVNGTFGYNYGKAEGEINFDTTRHDKFYDKQEYKINSDAFIMGGEVSLTKKIFIRRLVLAPELGFGFNYLSIDPDNKTLPTYKNGGEVDTMDWYFSTDERTFGLTTKMGIEYAIAPLFHIGGSIGYNVFTKGKKKLETMWKYYGEDNDYKDGSDLIIKDNITYSGMTWTGYVSFAFPSGFSKHKDLVRDDISAKDGTEEPKKKGGFFNSLFNFSYL